MIGATVIFVLGGILFNPIILLLAVVMGVVDYFKLPSLDLEYEYLYVNGELDIDKIMSKQKRKRVGSYDMKKVEIVARKIPTSWIPSVTGKISRFTITLPWKKMLRPSVWRSTATRAWNSSILIPMRRSSKICSALLREVLKLY